MDGETFKRGKDLSPSTTYLPIFLFTHQLSFLPSFPLTALSLPPLSGGYDLRTRR